MARKPNNTALAPVNGAAAPANLVPCRLPVAAATLAEVGVDAGTWMVLVDSIFPGAKTPEGVALAIRYCQARGLDVMKRPVHIVPMWSKALGREVETVWPGIAEVRITAARTGTWVGMDSPKFGPDQTVLFKGTIWEDSRRVPGEVEVTFPEWAEVTVYRLVSGQRAAFSARVYWEETYARAGQGGLPNDMWQKRPRGQLGKCAEAAALRTGFPEEAGYTAEEMAGKPIEGDVAVLAAGNGAAGIHAVPATVSASVPDCQTKAGAEPVEAEDVTPTEIRAEEIDASVRETVANVVAWARRSGAWTAARERGQQKLTGAHLRYFLTELDAAMAAAQANADAAQTAIDPAKAAAAAA